MSHRVSKSFSRIRFVRFLTGGGLATLTHWLIMLALVRAGIDPRVSTAAGATVGLFINYLAQYHYTFRSDLSHQTAFFRYLSSAVAGWVLNVAVFSAAYSIAGSTVAAQAIATLASMITNYCLAERFVFHEKTANQPQ